MELHDGESRLKLVDELAAKDPQVTGDELREWREELGYTQEQLADWLINNYYMGSERAIRYWEKSEYRIPLWMRRLIRSGEVPPRTPEE